MTRATVAALTLLGSLAGASAFGRGASQTSIHHWVAHHGTSRGSTQSFKTTFALKMGYMCNAAHRMSPTLYSSKPQAEAICKLTSRCVGVYSVGCNPKANYLCGISSGISSGSNHSTGIGWHSADGSSVHSSGVPSGSSMYGSSKYTRGMTKPQVLYGGRRLQSMPSWMNHVGGRQCVYMKAHGYSRGSGLVTAVHSGTGSGHTHGGSKTHAPSMGGKGGKGGKGDDAAPMTTGSPTVDDGDAPVVSGGESGSSSGKGSMTTSTGGKGGMTTMGGKGGMQGLLRKRK